MFAILFEIFVIAIYSFFKKLPILGGFAKIIPTPLQRSGELAKPNEPMKPTQFAKNEGPVKLCIAEPISNYNQVFFNQKFLGTSTRSTNPYFFLL